MPEPARCPDSEASFERLVNQYGNLLRKAVVRVCSGKSGSLVDDIEQEARIRLWRAVRNERNLANPPSYIYRVGVTAAIDAMRRFRARHEEQLSALGVEDGSGEEPSRPFVIPTDPDRAPDVVAIRAELIRKVEATVAGLADNQRIAIELHLQGMTTREIADLSGWTEPKARNLVYRGLSVVRAHLRAGGLEFEQGDKA